MIFDQHKDSQSLKNKFLILNRSIKLTKRFNYKLNNKSIFGKKLVAKKIFAHRIECISEE